MITTKMKAPSAELMSLITNSTHTLIAGTTGSGKSVLLNSILYALALNVNYTFLLIDTKRVELKEYAIIPRNFYHITEPEQVPEGLDLVIEEMERRYSTMVGKKSDEPSVYVVIDELADLVTSNDEVSRRVLNQIIKIGRLGRAANIHMICCTQDPSRRTLSAQLMQNFTTCIALRCKTDIESRQIIGIDGAESLPRYGKAIVSSADGYKTIDVPFTPDEDIKELCESLADLHQWVIDLKNYNEEIEFQASLENDKYNRLVKPLRKGKLNPPPVKPQWLSPDLESWLKDGSWVERWV